jgi:hypothetical protein
MSWRSCGASLEDLDLEQRRAPVRSKGGDTEFIYWDTGTAHLLPRLLRLPDGTFRTSGPLFLGSRKPVPARRPAPRDICPHTGRARLGYDRARVLLKKYTATAGFGLAVQVALRPVALHRRILLRPVLGEQLVKLGVVARTGRLVVGLGHRARGGCVSVSEHVVADRRTVPAGCCRPRCLHMVRQQSLLMKRQRSVSLYPRPAAPGAGAFP